MSGPAPANDRYDRYSRQPDPAPRPDRGQPQDKPQASFSAYRPEAYAESERQERRAPSRPERPEWSDNPRAAPAPSRPSAASADPYPRKPPQSRDPYYQNAPADPYAAPSSQSYDQDWRRDPYQQTKAGPQYPSYYPQHEDPPGSSDLESVHDRFFAPDPEPARTPPQQQRFGSDFNDGFNDHGFGSDPSAAYSAQPSPYEEPAQRHHGVHTMSSGLGDPAEAEWDRYEQTPPPPQSVRPFHPPAKIPEDDLDADFFADDDDYDHEEYGERKGGRKKLMAAVLVGAVAVGGALAYVYKTSTGEGEGGPSLISADSGPVKVEPSNPGGREFANGNKLIYDRLGGAEGASDQQAGGGDASKSTAASSGDNLPGIVTTGGTLEERIENALKAQKDTDGPAAPANDQQPASPDSPRSVKTVTFGPDGNPKPVEPSVQRIPVASASADSVSAGVVVSADPSSSRGGRSASFDSVAASPSQASAAPDAAPERPVTKLAANTAQAPQIVESAGGAGSYFVQIAARNDQEAAVAAFAGLQQKYAGVLGNYSPSVRKVDLGDKGVWYRLLVGPVESKTEADELCERLKGAGMKSCFSRKD
jgi:hypothetical protein